MAIQKILVPTDFSESAARACEVAGTLAKSLGASVHLLHVLHLPVQAVTPEAPVVPVGFWGEISDRAEQRLTELKQEFEKQGVHATSEVFEDLPSFAISSVAERVQADLIVMGSRGLSGVKHMVFGSVAERTVRTAPCPVLTVKAESGPFALRRILVPTDFSEPANRALALAEDLARRAGSVHIVLLHAFYIPIDLEQYLVAHGDPVLEQRMLGSVGAELEQVVLRLKTAGFSAEYVTARGAPEAVVSEITSKQKIDLIALGTHGRRGLSHLLLGSVAERVVRSAHCPVLTTRG